MSYIQELYYEKWKEETDDLLYATFHPFDPVIKNQYRGLVDFYIMLREIMD